MDTELQADLSTGVLATGNPVSGALKWVMEFYTVELLVVVVAAYMRFESQIFSVPELELVFPVSPIDRLSKFINASDWALAMLVATAGAFIITLRAKRSALFTLAPGIVFVIFLVRFSNQFHSQSQVEAKILYGLQDIERELMSRSSSEEKLVNLATSVSELRPVADFLRVEAPNTSKNTFYFSLMSLFLLFNFKLWDLYAERGKLQGAGAWLKRFLVFTPCYLVILCIALYIRAFPVGDITIIDEEYLTGTPTKRESLKVDNSKGSSPINSTTRSITFTHEITLEISTTRYLDQTRVKKYLMKRHALPKNEVIFICKVPFSVAPGKQGLFETVYVPELNRGTLIERRFGIQETLGTYTVIVGYSCGY